MPPQDHKALAGERPVPTAIITCSDTRTPDNDTSGQMIRQLLSAAGHSVVFYAVCKDEPSAIDTLLSDLIGRPEVKAIVLNGGTGVSPRDNTFDTVSKRITKALPGFGEIFRMLSYDAIGSSAMLSRATAGLIVPAIGEPKIVFSIPGSPNAVELAMTKLILPELSHLAWESTR